MQATLRWVSRFAVSCRRRSCLVVEFTRWRFARVLPKQEWRRLSRPLLASALGLCWALHSWVASTTLSGRVLPAEARSLRHDGGIAGYLFSNPFDRQVARVSGSNIGVIAVKFRLLMFRSPPGHRWLNVWAAGCTFRWIPGATSAKSPKTWPWVSKADSVRVPKWSPLNGGYRRSSPRAHGDREPVLAEVPKSDRVAKERQKPLFTEMPDKAAPSRLCWTAH
jgi:hypothetical protein